MRTLQQRVRAKEDIRRKQLVVLHGDIAEPQAGLTAPDDAELAVALEDIPAGRWGMVERWVEKAEDSTTFE